MLSSAWGPHLNAHLLRSDCLCWKRRAVVKRFRSVLKQAYPSGANIDDALVDLLLQPSQRDGAAEAFRGFINLFDDYLAPQLMQNLSIPVDLIWGERDPWEPLPKAQRWCDSINCVRTLTVISEAGHCPHDEAPGATNEALLKTLMTPMPP